MKILKILLIVVLLASCHTEDNKRQSFKLIQENIDHNFSIDDIVKIYSFKNEHRYFNEKCNLSLLVEFSDKYNINNLLNSSSYLGFGLVQDFIQLGYVESTLIQNFSNTNTNAHILISYGDGYRPPNDSSYSKPINDYVLAIFVEETNKMYIHKYIA